MRPVSKLRPAKQFEIYRRNLPHWELPGSVYFLTFTVRKGVALSNTCKDITWASINYHTGKKYRLYACVIMDTHVHVVLQPLKTSRKTYYSLAQITHSIKSYSAKSINKELNREGTFWMDENFDRIIRNEKDYLEILDYIINNPITAGYVSESKEYRWLFYEGA